MTNDITRILITIHPELLGCVDTVAGKAGVSRSWLIRRILAEWLAAHGFDDIRREEVEAAANETEGGNHADARGA